MYRKFFMCFHSLSCPAAAIVFPNCNFQYFPLIARFNSNLLHPLRFQTLSWAKFTVPDPSVICTGWLANRLRPCVSSHVHGFIWWGNLSFQKGKAAPVTPCPVWIPQIVPCSLPLMCWTGGCTALAIYFERLEYFKLLVVLKTSLFKYCMQDGVSK